MRKEFIEHYQGSLVDAVSILQAQDIARECLLHMSGYLRPGLNREEIHEECERFMLEKGSQGWWIHNDPALILFGDLSTYSAHEDPSPLFENKLIFENDLITIDVAPMINKGWGDLARSFIMEEGKIIPWQSSKNEEIVKGMELELKLHELFINSVKPGITFAMLHEIITSELNKAGYYNCDYHDNFGHTIENDQSERVTIAKGVDIDIVAYDKPITFEPHICKINGRLGIKHENMYFYHHGKMEEVI